MSGLRCILVDDSNFILKILSQSVTRLSHEVIATYSSGSEFLKDYSKYEFDLIFLDIILPDISGLDVLANIIQANPLAKVVILTGLAEDNIISTALQIGAIDFIIKPFKEEKLRDVLHAIQQSVKGPFAEAFSKVELAVHLTNLFIQELLYYSTTIVRKVIRSQIESILLDYQTKYNEVFNISVDNHSLGIADTMWGNYTEAAILILLKKMQEDLRFELSFLYSDEFVNDLFTSAFTTFYSRPRIQKRFLQIIPGEIGLPKLPELSLTKQNIMQSTTQTFEQSIAIALFCMGDMGPQIYQQVNPNLIDEQDILKSTIFYYTMIQQEQKDFQGIFGPLPVSTDLTESRNPLSAIVYATTLDTPGFDGINRDSSCLIIIFYNSQAENIANDYNRLSFIIRSRLGNKTNVADIDKAQVAGMREDIVEYLTD